MPLVSLVGMPGSGKSTIGRQLAKRLNVPFIDTDAVIERRIGCSIRSFFESEGEAPFRDIEQEVLAEVATAPIGVVATGGGVILREQNRRLLSERTTVVYLRSTPEDIARRLRHDVNRPLLQGADPLAKIRGMFAEREPLYRGVAQFTVETGRPPIPMVVNMILMQLELAGLVDSSRVPSSGTPRAPR